MFKLIAGLAAVLIIGLGAYFFMSSNSEPEVSAENQPAGELPTDKVEGQDIVVGEGREAVPGTQVTVDYIGQLPDGTVFDSSETSGQPLVFTLGAPGIIAGFQIGVNGMREGGERAVYIPPALAYGDQAVGAIPANSPLIFRLRVISVTDAPAETAPTE